ncbi:cysteine protease StiP family protein [Streptoalloteichus hindustanus]|uniref:PELOTA RNA binding domain-containing protein n=1 Tax=Streptoalloteichus hindustanus TaxID=2017 RepID=A0A1M5D3B6_STRHI|nr:cysteine protease StiP family protein [Streptoalloteichus hindustanus]SHF61466.1 PELOTA RNA binding domain-containing protein [Streptoalloteichus hindustanus]
MRLPTPLHGPAFSTYRAEEVTWLLTDLSTVDLELGLADRERRVRSGTHYAEMLPVEYQPGLAYVALFHQMLARTAPAVARAVAVVTESVLAARGRRVVLVSLARAGTPVGILMRRWAAHAHGLALPHYTISIVRDRGIDPVALRYLAAHHDPSTVVFVDGWTGKGAIARELNLALDRASDVRFASDLAVLADPAHCGRWCGTREDLLVPSAMLNATVTGLVSRTVLRADLVGPNTFHGAKFYAHLTAADVSARFLDTVTAAFPALTPPFRPEPAASTSAGPVGWATARRVARSCGIADLNLVKPGLGETTRVLLRRVPWKVFVRSLRDPEVAHILLLARQRGVDVVEVPGLLPYRSVGVVRPRFAQGDAPSDAQGGAQSPHGSGSFESPAPRREGRR